MTALSDVVHGIGAPPAWKQCASGKGLDILSPSPDAIDFNDMATALSLICRFNGAMRDPQTFYSVAQHSILVSFLVPDSLRLYGLLHDGHEYILGDDSTPKKNALAFLVPDAANALRDLKHRWDLAIWEAAGVRPPTADEIIEIRNADHLALAVERRDLLAEPRDATTRAAWGWLPQPPAGITVRPVLPQKACDWFLNNLAGCVWQDGRRVGVA